MILETTMLYLYVETPLHAGTGSGLSNVELPIQRERTTQYPMIQGSGIKGKLRSAAYAQLSNAANGALQANATTWSIDEISIVFGPEDNGADHASALIIGDARILLFPVRSINGVFAYITSFDILNRFLRDLKRGGANSWDVTLDDDVDEHIALIPQKKCAVATDNTLVLEEFSFTAKPDSRVDEIAQWIANHVLPQKDEYRYWREKVKTSLVILSNNDFRDFVVNATEIITRVRIKRDTKTVEGGALWTEEHLPADTVLYVPIYATDARKQKSRSNGQSEPAMSASSILTKARSRGQNQQGYLQLGGDETVGRGIVCMQWEKEK